MRLVQVAQGVHQLDRAAAFYTDLLGTGPRAVYEQSGLVFFDVGGVRLLLDRGAPLGLIYLDVGDLRASVERLRAAGTTIETEPHEIFRHEDGDLGPAGTVEWMAFIRDSEGNLVGLVEQRPAGSDGAP